MEVKRPIIDKSILKKIETGGVVLPDIQLYY